METVTRPGVVDKARVAAAAVAVAGLCLAGPETLAGQDPPPDGRWVTRTTEHFRVTHPEHLPELGRRAAERAEEAFASLEAGFVEPPDDRVDIVVGDHADAANGFAQVFPTNRVVVLTPPPTDGLSLAYFDEWIDLVLIHELAHIFHLDDARGPAAVARALFGRAPSPWPWFPGLTTPRWVREGMATWYESVFTGAGRHFGTYFDMQLRTAVLEDAFEELDQVSGASPIWPHGDRPYVYGTEFLAYLLERHGEERTGDFVRSVAGRWIPYRLNAAAEEAFGVSFSDAWTAWREELEGEVDALVDRLRERAPVTRPEPLTRHGRFALRPMPSPDGRGLAYARSDGRNRTEIHRIALAPPGSDGPDGGSASADGTRTNGLADLSWDPDGGIVFSQLEFTDRYRVRSDLHRVGSDGDTRRLTEGARLDQPDVAPDGSIVAVQRRDGSTRLVVVDPGGDGIRPLTRLRPDVHWAYPRVSPDGGWIAASRWERGEFDVVILDRDGRTVEEVTSDPAVDLAPAWSPDGAWLVWGSDRTGIWNVLAAPVDPATAATGPVRQLTNVLTGVAYPSVGADGRWLYVSGYHADGWAVERIRFEPEEGFEPLRRTDPADRAAGVGGSSESAAVSPSPQAIPEPEPYSAGSTVLPRYWLPEYLPGEEAVVGVDGRPLRTDVLPWAVGAGTSGRDVLGRHSYGLRAVVAPETGRFEGSADYRYAGLGNPVLGLSVRQDWEAPAFGLTAATDEGSTPLFPVRRRRAVGATLDLLRRRYRHRVALQLGAGFLREEEHLRTATGERSEAFRPSLPRRDLVEGTLGFVADHTQSHPFSVAPEDGARGIVRLRLRRHVALADSLQDVAGFDRSFRDVVAGVELFKSVPGPGFANHVLILRGRGVVARGSGADAAHVEVGGETGGVLGFAPVGDRSLTLPVRGVPPGARFGRYAWSATAEYRFPLLLVHRGLGLLPLYGDRISGGVFLDAGNAWGPRLGGESVRFENPRRPYLASAGAEAAFDLVAFWNWSVRLRAGLAAPLRPEGGGLQGYVLLGF